MVFYEWAQAWQISPQAVQDLAARLLAASQPLTGNTVEDEASESRVQSQVRLEAAARGDVMLFRNNVGSLQDERGQWVRYGLANDSKRINEVIKSADLIGVQRYIVQPQDVGHMIGRFVSVETKRRNWKPSARDSHTGAQMAWATLMQSYGAYAVFTSGAGTFNQLGVNQK